MAFPGGSRDGQPGGEGVGPSAASDEGDQLDLIAGREDVGGVIGASDHPGVHLDRDLDTGGAEALDQGRHRQALFHFPGFTVELDLHARTSSARPPRPSTRIGAPLPLRNGEGAAERRAPGPGPLRMGTLNVKAWPCASVLTTFGANARDVPGMRPRGRRNHMTRQLMFAACAVAAVAFTGCQDQRRNAADRMETDQYTQQVPGQDGYTGQETQQQQDLAQDPAYAQTEPMEQDPNAIGGSGQPQSLTGEVSESSNDALTVRDAQGQEVEIELNERTRFHGPDGQSLAAGDLLEGDQVRASFEDRDGDRIATDVTVTQSARGGSGLMDDAAQQTEDAWDTTQEGARDVQQDIDQRF